MNMYLKILIFILLGFSGCKKTEINRVNVNGITDGYKIRHTGVYKYYDTISVISNPESQSVFFIQDAKNYDVSDNFIDNGDGTITDKVTGLMWTKNLTPKLRLEDVKVNLSQINAGKYNDWRIPSIKELFSLIDYTGQVFGDKSIRLFIDTTYFNQPLGNTAIGEREIDAQTWSSTDCQSLTMGKDKSRYGVNFIDGRIKAYPITEPFSGLPNKLHFRFVRGNLYYGYNKFIDNGDGTITDEATGLIWQKEDSKIALDWKSALEYARNLNLVDHNDWRLPTIKELQSLVVYENQVDETGNASISELFQTSRRNNPNGTLNYPYYWSSTTLLDGPQPGNQAAYVCFGKASAFFNGQYVDAHGTGAVRSDLKYLQHANYPISFGPQGDLVYVRNYVRCVRNVK
jgi:phage baseplate assembly protein gpV